MNTNKKRVMWVFTVHLLCSFNLQATLPYNATEAAHTGMVKIPAGNFKPFYKKKGSDYVKIKSFYLDAYPVTNEQYLAFVKANRHWARSVVKRLFADTNYLKNWQSDYNMGSDSDKIKNSPVTNISWFAADAYCKWKGKRLPTTIEWEYAASADRINKKQGDTMSLTTYILNWYSKPAATIVPNVGSTFKNRFSVWDMHGLIWEWAFDFNTSITGGDSRSNAEIDRNFSCASGSLSSTNKEDYASYMRYAYRGSLKATYTVNNLGFRCAMDVK